MSDHRDYLVGQVGDKLIEEGWSEYHRTRLSHQVRCLTFCMNEPSSPELVAVQSHPEPFDPGDYDSDLRRLVDRLWDVAGGWDCGCSSGHMENLRFAYHAAMYAKDREEDDRRRKLKTEMESIERRKQQIVAELAADAGDAT